MPPYELTIGEHPTYLDITARGERTRENTLGILKDVHEACQRLGRRDVLLELALTGPSLDMTSILAVVSTGSAGAKGLRRIAYIEASPDMPGRAGFAETVAINRGVNVRLFADREAAIGWLLEPS